MTEESIKSFVFEDENLIRVNPNGRNNRWITADLCRALGIQNAAQAVEGLEDDEKGICSMYTPGGTQQMLAVSDGGMFTIILRCRDAMKKGTLPYRFRRWVTNEVLPSILDQGAYVSPFAGTRRDLPESLKIRTVSQCRLVWGNRAAAELWVLYGLPVTPSMWLPHYQGDMFMTWNPPSGGSSPPG